MCKCDAENLDFLAASFVCTPYSPANPKRHQPGYNPMNDPAASTFHGVRAAIAKNRPKYFVLENVDGVSHSSKTETGEKKPPPLEYMLNDKQGGLRSAGYLVDVVNHLYGTRVGLPQVRGRTLFFGTRDDLKSTSGANVLLETFQRILGHCDGSRVYHIDTFISATEPAAEVEPGDRSSIDELGVNIDYNTELRKNLRKAQECELLPKNIILPPDSERPSFKFRQSLSASCSARVDIFDAIIKAKVAATHMNHPLVVLELNLCCAIRLAVIVSGSVCSNADWVPAKVDASQNVERHAYRTDGTVPTLCTGSHIFSYKLGKFLSAKDLAVSMGMPRENLNLTMVSEVAARKIVGNGYVVPLAAIACAAVCVQTGHLVKA